MIPPSFLLLDKREGVTSFSALGAVKRLAGTKKVGHTGTLDAFASGLLVVLLGHATKLSGTVTGLDKRYEAEFVFGQTTNTLDPTGEITGDGPVPSAEEVASTLPTLTGTILQRPPVFSAVHVGGKRASDLARRGETPQPAPREVHVRRFELGDVDGNRFSFVIECSKGTYVRSLAGDLAAACGTVAHVTRLRRTHVGPLDVSRAVSAETIAYDAQRETVARRASPPAGNTVDAACPDAAILGPAESYIRPATELIRMLWGDVFITLGDGDVRAVQNGVPARHVVPNAQTLDEHARLALVDPRGDLVAMVCGDRDAKPAYMFVVPRPK